jgi:hypothetical protein
MAITDEDELTTARKRDALALALLILDIYNRKKREGTLPVSEKAKQ